MLENISFLTYGDDAYKNSKIILKDEAIKFGFKNFIATSPDNLSNEFRQNHFNFLKNNKRGAGYWLWKPYIVSECLKNIKNNDFLLYADAGCSVNINGRNRFSEWVEMCNQHGVLSFQMNHLPEKHWTKMNLVQFMNCNTPDMLESGQLMATTFLIKKTNETIDLINEWLRICSLEWTIDDSPSTINNDLSFKDHRHDQSVFSLLRKKMNYFCIEDETYPSKTNNWNDLCMSQVPIWATRRKF